MSFYVDRCMVLNDVDIREKAAAEYVLPGDWYERASGRFDRVLTVRYIKDDRPHGKDRVEFTFDVDDHVWARSDEMFVDAKVCFARDKSWGQKKTW